MKWNALHLKHLKDSGKIRDYSCSPEPVAKSKRAKYGNTKVEWDNMVFDSRKEFKVYRELLLRLKVGEIGQLQRQVKYLLIPANEKERKCEYFADFVWIEAKTGKTVVCDVKGMKTDVYRIKKKLMKQLHNIEILEL